MNYSFKVDDIFSVQRCANLKSELCTPGNIHYVTRTALNNGVQNLCGNDDYINDGNCIIIGGESAVAFYQNEPFVTGNNITVLRNEKMSELSGLYIVTILNKFTPLYSYSKAWNTKRIRETIISLPVIESSDPHHVYTPDDIDWTYMEDHIRRLEEDHIRRLEAYLRVAGFESTILTPEEQEALRKFRTGGVIFRKYRICDLFEIRKVYGKPIKAYPSGTIPYISGARDNNGCIGFVSAPGDAISEGNCISVDPITGASRYQPKKFVGRGFSGASVNTLYNQNINPKNALYLCGAIEKMASGVASYSHLLNGKKLANAEVSLPCLPSGTPDYALMEVYIRALEKQAISRLDIMQKEEEKITKKLTKG